MSKVSQEVVILMNTAFHLELWPNVKERTDYSKLFDSLMTKAEQSKALLSYIYETIKSNMFELKDITFQRKEYLRLINLNSLTEEFNNDLKKELKCLDY